MKRLTEEKAEQMLAFFAKEIDFENLPLDDAKTYELFQRADTDGIFMFESDWDKYDLLQIKPKNMEELTATMAFSHGLAINPYIYTYLKIQEVHPFTYPRFTEMPKIREILDDTHGILLWKEQKEEILAFFDSLNDSEREYYKMAISIVLHEIELRSTSLSNRSFFKKRALLCINRLSSRLIILKDLKTTENKRSTMTRLSIGMYSRWQGLLYWRVPEPIPISILFL